MKLLLWGVVLLNTFALLVCAIGFYGGSLELFPTEEQEAAVRIWWGIFFGLFLFSEITLLFLMKRLI